MNIFVLDTDPVKAAESQCDKHVVKMVLETAQLLSSAHWLHGSSAPYKATHLSHPCTKWVSSSRENYLWLCRHGLALCAEYTVRYNKVHKTEAVIRTLAVQVPANMPSKGLTPFVIAINKDTYGSCIIPGDPVSSYRNYYKTAKKSFAKWKRNEPDWW